MVCILIKMTSISIYRVMVERSEKMVRNNTNSINVESKIFNNILYYLPGAVLPSHHLVHIFEFILNVASASQ